MNTAAYRANVRKLVLLAALVLLAVAGYLFVGVNFSSHKLFSYAMRLRIPKLIVMLITAFAIGGASIVFQSIINNRIVTPCLLGMNSLYSLIHTAVVFFAGSGSLLARNANASFAVDLALMGVTATVIYSYLFQKTNHNVLYVLLIGTVLTSFFGSCRIVKHVGERIETGSLLAKANGVVSSVYCWNGHYGRRAVFQSHEGRRNGVSHRNASDPHDGFFQPCRCVLACKAG